VENLFADALWKSAEAGKTSLSMLFGRALKRGRPLRQCPLKKGGREEGNLSVTPAACHLPWRGEAERKSYY
jgi:hypothetical protein